MQVTMVVSISDSDWSIDVEGALGAAKAALRAHDIDVLVEVRGESEEG